MNVKAQRHYDRDNPPPASEFKRYSRMGVYGVPIVINAARIIGPFSVDTVNGEITCEDGYIARVGDGNLYAIPKGALAGFHQVDLRC